MRRAEREVVDFNEILDILRRCDTVRLGLAGDEYPYVVPLSFGFEAAEGEIILYFHGASDGLKHDLIAKNPRVCVEGDILHRYVQYGSHFTAEYESFIGFGTAERVFGRRAVRGLDLLMEHCGFGGCEYDPASLERTAVYAVKITEFTGKRRFL